MDDFDLTQPMSLCYDDDDPSTEANEAAILKIPLQDGIPRELEFPLFNGVNKIGRSESCEVCISNKVLSKEHAVIEVGGDCFLIYDLNSSNKTWRGKKPLKPNVKYKLEPSEEVRFGNIKAQFIVKKHEVDDEDSGSETGSESMLLLNEEYHAFSMSTPIKDSGVNDRGNDPSEDASTSDVLFPKNTSTAEAKKAESPKEAALDLENAPTQVFNGSDLSDSGDETDCEKNSALKAVAGEKEIHCDRAPDPGVGGETTTKQTTSDNIIKIVDSGGVSGVSSKSFQKVPDQIQKDENMINTLLPVKNSFKELQELPECHSLESNEDLPATQLNFDLQEPGVSGYSRNTESAKELNNEHKGEVLGSLDSLPETQINIDLEIPESPQAKANDDLPPTQCSSNSESNVGNFNNNVSKRRVKVLESDDNTDDSDDLPPTQPNLALQFSEEQNFLQRGDSQSLFSKHALSSGASTSYAANWCKNTVVPNPLLCSVESSKISNISSEGYPKKTDRLSSSSNKSCRAPFLTSINISLEEGSTEDGSILCPSTLRRSDVCNEKIKNTDVQCSPTLGVASTEQGEDSIAETPPHLLKESTFSFGNSSAVTSLSKQFAEVSPSATANSSSRSHSRLEIRTSDDSHTPSTHGKRESKVPTPDSAKAGELNYSVNCSSKVYKPKLNDMNKDSQEIVHPEQNVSETINSSVLKNTGKLSTAREAALMLANEDNRESDDSDAADRGKRKSKISKKHTAVKKTDDHGTEVGRRAVAKRLSPDSDTQSKAKKSRTRKAIAGGKLTDLSTGHHNFETNDHEGSNQDEMPQRRKSKRCAAVPAKYVDLESDISKKPRFESGNDTEQSSVPECRTEQPILEDSTVSSTNTSDSKPSVNRRSARKKKSKNDQDIQPTRRSKRQKDISPDVMKGLDESDSRDDFESIPPRKTARRKLLQSESGLDVSDSKQEVGFCVFRKSEALEVEADNLLDSRTQKRRKPSPLKNNLNDGPPQPKEQSKKLNQLTLNSSEVSVGSSGEQCNITVQNGQSDHVENLKSDDKNEKLSFGDDSSGLRTRAVRGLTGLSVPIQRLPNTPPQRSRVKRKTPGGTDKSEMQSDPHSETMKSNGHLSNTENEAEESTLSEKRDSPDKKRVSRLRRSHKKGAPHADSTDESFSTTVSLDTSVKTDEGTALTELKKNCLGNIRAPRSKRLRKKEEVPTEDSLSSAILDSSTRSLRLRLSTSEASADERPSASEKCQISVFAKDSVKSLIKLDSGSLDSNESKDREVIPSRVSRKAKPSEKEVNEATISEVKNSQKSKAKLDSEDPPSPPTGRRKNKRNQNLNLSLVSDSVSEKDATPAKNKKTKGTKNKHVAFTSPSPRQQQQVPKPKVMFTMVEDEEPQKVVVDLGGKVVEDVKLCTHLVAEKLRRTVKALCCIAKGIPLVNTKWIQECKKSESFLDHAPYLIKDKAAEKQYQFELKKTLQKANEKPLLTSWSVHVTPKVVPSPEQMKDIIQCAGGKYLPKMPNRLSEKTVVITCAPDLNLCSHASKCGIPVVGSEFILTGLLQYKIDTKSYMLCKK